MMKRNITLLLAVVVLVGLVAVVLHYMPSLSAEGLYNWYKDHMTYGVIVLLMAIESSIIPLPSEVVVPPAAYFALQQGSNLNVWMVIVMATLGAFLGSAINYGLSVLLGRPIIYAFAESRVGHLLRLSAAKLDHAEAFFRRRGSVSIFFGRLLPVVRHLISIPAGLARMNFATFSIFTILGAALWNVVLASLGYLLFLVVPDDSMLFAQLEHYSTYMKIAGFVLLAAIAAYIYMKYRKNRSVKSEQDNNNSSSEP